MAIYYLCSKSAKTKNGDRVVAFILTKNGYGNPFVREFWIPADSDVANSVLDLIPGCAVRCHTVFGNERALEFIEENPDSVPLDLTDFLNKDC